MHDPKQSNFLTKPGETPPDPRLLPDGTYWGEAERMGRLRPVQRDPVQRSFMRGLTGLDLLLALAAVAVMLIVWEVLL